MLLENMDQATTSISSSPNHEETGMEEVLSDLQSLKRLYGLLHKGPANDNLDEASRALLMRLLDDASQQVLLRQAKMLSGFLMSPTLERKLSVRSDLRTRDAEPRLKPLERPARAEGPSSTRRFEKLGSGLSVTMRPPRGLESLGHGVVTRRHSSSSSSSTDAAAIRSRIRPNRELERCLRQAEEEETTLRRPREDGAVSGVGWSSQQRQTLKRSNSGSIYSSSSPSGAASSFPSTNPTVSPASRASASYSSPVSGRRRRGRQEKREGRLQRLKNKIAMVFHYHHDHHHHHHFGCSKEGTSKRDGAAPTSGKCSTARKGKAKRRRPRAGRW